MKKIMSVFLALVLILSSVAAVADEITVAVPNDPTNCGRALLLLQSMGVIKLDENAGITALPDNITENPLGIKIVMAEAAMLPNQLADVDYAIINNNYALDAGIISQALNFENADSPYANIVCVNAGNEETDEAKALVAAICSQKVADFINTKYDGAAISVVAEPTDGFDASLDYAALAGKKISIAASPTPHAEILELVKEILAEKDITLEVIEFTDYVVPNQVVDSGEVFSNYFAHWPYQENFNAENGTNLVNIASVHVEPMGIYGGKQADLTALTVK